MPMSLLRLMIDNGLLVEGHSSSDKVALAKCHDSSAGDLDESRHCILDLNEHGPGRETLLSCVKQSVTSALTKQFPELSHS